MDESYFNKFSENAKRVLTSAQYLAVDAHAKTTTNHVLLGMLLHKDSLAHGILQSYDVTAQKIESELAHQGDATPKTRTQLPALAEDTRTALDRAMNIAAQFGHVGIDTEHLLLAVLSDNQSRAYVALRHLNIDPERIKNQVIGLFQELMQLDSLGSDEKSLPRFRPNQGDARDENEMPRMLDEIDGSDGFGPSESRSVPRRRLKGSSALDYFSTDLTKMAAEGKLDPVIGREQEITRVIEILSRRTKNNPVLIGEPGVGKTAIVEGIAQRIVSGDVPASLVGKKLLALDLALLVAGTMYRGQFEERIKKVIDELLKLDNAMLFMDELNTIIGAGSAEVSLDAAQILKPSLAKGQLRVIGATTLNEYQKHIERDAALTRRFQSIVVNEPSVGDSVHILEGIRPQYEQYHQVKITDEAIEAAVTLSNRYITDRYLPDKAIDLIDETAARVRSGNKNQKTLAELRLRLEQISAAKERAVLQEQYDDASKLQRKEEVVKRAVEKTSVRATSAKMIMITKIDIEKTIARLTGIPQATLASEDIAQIQQLEAQLRKSVIGQDEAIGTVARVIRRARTGIGQTARPTGSFIFLGPTGVGKSELAKVIARQVYGKESALVKIDMSEFMERHNVSRLIGAPAGYVGYEEGGKLSETIRHHPYSVILLDEIEKAHPDVFNMLLQILEDGFLTDAKGRRIDFRHALIIMTSNIGVEQMTSQATLGFQAENLDEEAQALKSFQLVKDDVVKSLHDHFAPEFLNRLDHIVVFNPLTKEHVRKIVDLHIEELIARAKERGLKVQVDQAARKYLAEHGYDPKNGARPIRRLIQSAVEDKLADAILEGRLDKRKTAVVRHIDNELVVT